MALVPFGDDNLISLAFGEHYFILLRDLFMVLHLLKPVDLRLMVNEVKTLAKRRIRDVRGRLIKFIVYVG